MTSFAQNGLLLDVQHVTMRFGRDHRRSTTCPCGIPTVHPPAHRPQRRGQDHGLQRHQRLLQPPGRRHPVQGPQREGLPAAPDLQGGHGPDLPEHPALRQRNRAGKRHGRLSGPPQKPMVDARLQPAQRTARGRGNPREGEGPHPPPRARFLHGRKGVEPALRGAAALESPARWRPARTSCSSTSPPP